MAGLQIGAGGVGWVVAHKLAQYNDVFGDITLASRTVAKCDTIIESILRKNNLKDTTKRLTSAAVDADSVEALIALIPEAYDPQWAFRERFEQAGITGLLGCGFDPGVVSVFAAYAWKHMFDEIDTIDVMDVNAGNHGRKFATNFDPETNMLEIQGDSFYWEQGEWKRVPCHTRMMEFDFPVVGDQKVYSMAHDEVRSMAEYIPVKKRIEFWMGFGDNYLKYFNVMRDIGLLSPDPVTTVDGVTVSPLKVLKAILPEPTSLAKDYTGNTCIGTMVAGQKDGKERKVFIYNICDHKACYEEVESQAISYTTGVPAITAALLYFKGQWNQKGLFNVEQLDPDPYLELMPSIGLSWDVVELDPAQDQTINWLGDN